MMQELESNDGCRVITNSNSLVSARKNTQLSNIHQNRETSGLLDACIKAVAHPGGRRGGLAMIFRKLLFIYKSAYVFYVY